jgi:hypothetical protein
MACHLTNSPSTTNSSTTVAASQQPASHNPIGVCRDQGKTTPAASRASLCLITVRLSSAQSSGWFAQTYQCSSTLPHTPSPHFSLGRLCLTTDCTIPERDPCASKQQLHFEPGRPLFLPPMTAMLSRLGSPKPGGRSGVCDSARPVPSADQYISLCCRATLPYFCFTISDSFSISHPTRRIV